MSIFDLMHTLTAQSKAKKGQTQNQPSQLQVSGMPQGFQQFGDQISTPTVQGNYNLGLTGNPQTLGNPWADAIQPQLSADNLNQQSFAPQYYLNWLNKPVETYEQTMARVGRQVPRLPLYTMPADIKAAQRR